MDNIPKGGRGDSANYNQPRVKNGAWTNTTNIKKYETLKPKDAAQIRQMKPPADDIIKCPLCYDPIIEATSSTCGHLFCRDCIHKWKAIKNQCPICQDSLSKLHRVYEVDRVIENHLPEFPLDFLLKVHGRRSRRLAQAERDRNSKGPVKYLQHKVARLSLYFQSKGLLRGIGRGLYGFWKNYMASLVKIAIKLILVFIFGILIGTAYCSISPSHFIAYLWNAITDYPGMNMGVKPKPSSQPELNDPCTGMFKCWFA